MIAAGCDPVAVPLPDPDPDSPLPSDGAPVPLDSLVFAGVVAVGEDFGVGAVSGIFGGVAEPVEGRGVTAGVSEAFGVGVTAPGVVGVGVTGVVGPGIITDVDVKVASNILPSIPTSIGEGRCFLRFGHVVLPPLT